MGTSVTPTPDKETLAAALRQDVFLDDVGDKLKEDEAKAKADADATAAKKKAEDDAKLQAEARAAIPDDPRVKALAEALRISEEARLRQASSLQPPLAAKKEDDEPELTREQVNELHQKDPLAAIEYMLKRGQKIVEDNFARRITTLSSSGASIARESAERKYPDEFKLFGQEINEFIEKMPNKGVLGTAEGWDDLISWMRGKPANFDKLVTHRTEQAKARAAEEARQREAQGAGAHTASQIRSPAPAGGGEDLDDTAKEIARALNPGLRPEQAYAEYKKWRNVAS